MIFKLNDCQFESRNGLKKFNKEDVELEMRKELIELIFFYIPIGGNFGEIERNYDVHHTERFVPLYSSHVWNFMCSGNIPKIDGTNFEWL